jgi:hypothetical protein
MKALMTRGVGFWLPTADLYFRFISVFCKKLTMTLLYLLSCVGVLEVGETLM